ILPIQWYHGLRSSADDERLRRFEGRAGGGAGRDRLAPPVDRRRLLFPDRLAAGAGRGLRGDLLHPGDVLHARLLDGESPADGAEPDDQFHQEHGADGVVADVPGHPEAVALEHRGAYRPPHTTARLKSGTPYLIPTLVGPSKVGIN